MLNKYFSVYVPSTYEITKKINNKPFVKQVSKAMARLFGGATAYKAQGSWIAENKQLVNEDITIIKSYCDNETFSKSQSKVVAIAKALAEAMKQEAVSIETAEGLQFISKQEVI